MANKDDKFEELMKSGDAKIAEGDFEGAIEDFDKAINLNPADKSRLTEAYNSRGFAKSQLGRHKEAIENYDEAIRLDPEKASAWNNRGFAKIELGRHKEAIADLDEVIRLNPADKKILGLTYGKRGNVKAKLGRHEEAIADFDEAIRLAPEFASSWSNRGWAKNNLGHHEEAIKDFDEVIRLDPEKASAWNNRGWAKNRINRNEEAIADFDEAIRLDPEKASAWNNRGFAKIELGRNEEAIADLDEAIRLNPKKAIAWNNRGWAKSRINRNEEAITDFSEALRLDPQNAAARNNFAAIKAEQFAREAVEKRIGALEADTKEVKDQAEKYRKSEEANRRLAGRGMKRLGITFSTLIGGLIVLVLVSVILDALKITDVNIVSSPFSLLPWITIIVIITAPLVWTIRLRIVEANSAKIMQAEYRHLAYVEGRMLVYFPNQDADAGKEVRADYIKTTMTSSPSDKLLALENKANVLSPSPVQNVIETIRNKARGNLPS